MHCFLAASLPVLALDAAPPIEVPEFDAMCAQMMGEEEMAALCSFDGTVTPGFEIPEHFPAIYARFARFEEYLRCKVAKIRAERAGVPAELPDPPEYFPEFDFQSGTLKSLSDPAERERILDKLRWEFLDELSLFHDFDFEALCIYRLKLTIVNKYRFRQTEAGRASFEAALDQLAPAAQSSEQE